MNPFLLWVPGTALIVIGVVLAGQGIVSMLAGLTIAGAGVLIESIGVVLWLRERRSRR